MNSLRRVALRAASSAAAIAPKQQASRFVGRFAATATKAAVVPTARLFNTSVVRHNEEEFQALAAAPPANSTGGEVVDGFTKEANDVFGVFVWNIPYRSTEREMFDTFSRFGKVHSLNIGRDARGLSRGFAFIYYQTTDEAKAAVEQADGAFWQGRRIGAKPKSTSDAVGGGGGGGPGARREGVTPRPKSGPTASLYVGNIPYEATDTELNQLFANLENVLDVRVAIDKATGWPRGFAHADFADEESATRAMEKLSIVTIQGRQLRLDYSESKRSSSSFVPNSEAPGPNDKVL